MAEPAPRVFLESYYAQLYTLSKITHIIPTKSDIVERKGIGLYFH